MNLVLGLAVLVASLGLGTSVAHAQAADADTSLADFLGRLSDSTDVYFGPATAPVDTAGLDSAVVAGLANPDAPRRRSLGFATTPWSWFNRVDGLVYGSGLAVGRSSGWGRVGGTLGYAVGQKEWLGRARYRRILWRDEARWALVVGGGRWTRVMDRFRSTYGSFSTVRAFVAGSDSRFYLREDGWSALLERETPVWRARVGYHDVQQSPLEVTARWNLFNNSTRANFNVPAAEGRNRELRYDLTVRTPFLPAYVSGAYHTSSDAIGSDFEYRRTQLAAAGELAVGRWITVTPQVMYGRSTGALVPQAAFYLGGSRTLRTVDGSGLAGSGLALARLDVFGQPDILELLRIPHPAAFPLQLGAFVASGAAWGDDPYGGPPRPGIDWPHAPDWKSEFGIEVLYRPGLPQTDGFLRFSYAWPLGPDGERRARYTISYSQPMDLIDRPGRE